MYSNPALQNARFRVKQGDQGLVVVDDEVPERPLKLSHTRLALAIEGRPYELRRSLSLDPNMYCSLTLQVTDVTFHVNDFSGEAVKNAIFMIDGTWIQRIAPYYVEILSQDRVQENEVEPADPDTNDRPLATAEWVYFPEERALGFGFCLAEPQLSNLVETSLSGRADGIRINAVLEGSSTGVGVGDNVRDWVLFVKETSEVAVTSLTITQSFAHAPRDAPSVKSWDADYREGDCNRDGRAE